MAHGVNGAVKGAEVARMNAPLDLPARRAELDQLLPRDHPMLPGGKVPNDAIQRGWAV